MTKKLIVGSPQAMEREPSLDPEGSVRTVSGLRHNTLMNGNYRCTDPDCWCNNPRWKKNPLTHSTETLYFHNSGDADE